MKLTSKQRELLRGIAENPHSYNGTQSNSMIGRSLKRLIGLGLIAAAHESHIPASRPHGKAGRRGRQDPGFLSWSGLSVTPEGKRLLGFKIANPYWWEVTDEGYRFEVDSDKCIPVGDILEEFNEMIELQSSSGNWDFDPYMHGMANGMIFMRTLIDGQDPDYLEAPDVWLNDLPDDGTPPTACYDDEFGNQVCEGEPQIEESSMALVPFEEAAEEDALEADDDKVYFTAVSASKKRIPPFLEEKRTEDNPTIVETCGRNHILPECREEFEKGFNVMTAALAPFVRAATVPYEEVEVARWEVLDTQSRPMEEATLEGYGRLPENPYEQHALEGWEGHTILGTEMSGIPFKVRIDWFLNSGYKGPEDLTLHGYPEILEGPQDLKVEGKDGLVTSVKEWFKTEIPHLLWDYDLAQDVFPLEPDEFSDDIEPPADTKDRGEWGWFNP